MIGLIVARSKNNVIGKNGEIPWKIKGEQKHIKAKHKVFVLGFCYVLRQFVLRIIHV